jgi:hypothetical protein
MDIDELKTAWHTLDKRVNHSLALNLQTRRDYTMDRARASLNVLAWGPRIELTLDVIWAIFLGLFFARHFFELRFALPTLLLSAGVIVVIVSNARQLALLSGIDYSGPVLAIQHTLAEVYALRVRNSRRIFVFGPLLWTPLLIVGVRELGVDLYAVASGFWIAANLAFGLLVIAGSFWFSRRYAAKLRESTTAKKIADTFAGSSLTRAMTLVNEISEFGRE